MNRSLNIIWVRQGYSCGEYKSDNSFFSRFFGKTEDPVLHEAGIIQVQDLSQDFSNYFNGKIDLICSSELYGSIESAQVFSKTLDDSKKSENNLLDKVVVLPCINEEGNSIPKKFFKNCSGGSVAPPLMYCREDPNILILEELLKYYQNSQYYSDYKSFRKIVIPYLRRFLDYVYQDEKYKECYNIVIFSHSKYLQNKLNLRNPLENTQMVLEYKVDEEEHLKAAGKDGIIQLFSRVNDPNFYFRNVRNWKAYSKDYRQEKQKYTERCI